MKFVNIESFMNLFSKLVSNITTQREIGLIPHKYQLEMQQKWVSLVENFFLFNILEIGWMSLCGCGETLERSYGEIERSQRKWRELEKKGRENDHENECERRERLLKIKMTPLTLIIGQCTLPCLEVQVLISIGPIRCPIKVRVRVFRCFWSLWVSSKQLTEFYIVHFP